MLLVLRCSGLFTVLTISGSTSYTFVAFSRCPRSGGLAADFIKILKQFIHDGLQPAVSLQDLCIFMTLA